MKKIALFCLLLSSAVFGQDHNNTSPANINTTKTAKHINMPGTRLFIIPPDSFILEKQMGLVLMKPSTGAMLSILENKTDMYSEAKATFEKERFEARGAKIFKYEKLNINGFPGTLIGIDQEKIKQILFTFGDSTFLTSIIAQYSPIDRKTEKDLFESFNTIYFDKNHVPDPFEQALFTVDDNPTSFILKNQMGLIFTFTPGAAEVKRPQINILQQTLPDSLNLEQNLKRFAETSLQGGGDTEIITSSPTKIDGHNAHQLQIAGKSKDGALVDIHCTVVKKNEMGIYFFGIFDQGDSVSASEFKKFAQAIKIKP